MKQTTYSKFFAAAVLGLAIGAAQAGGIDALKKFNADADGLSGSFSQTVKNKKKTQTSGGTFQIMRPSILSDKNALDSSYSLKEDGSGDGIDYVLATPKKNNAGYQFIRIGFKGDTLAAMELKDGFGNQTSIKFSNVNTHPNLSRGNFKFVPPKGVDVLSQ